MPKSCQTMSDVRREIDRVDRALVPLLIERLDYIRQAGHIKPDRATVRDQARVEDVVSKVRASADALGGNMDYVEDVYRMLIEWSIQYEFRVWDEHQSPEEGAA